MQIPNVDAVRARAAELAFAKAIVRNDLRGLVVEVMVDFALKPSWRMCSGDWPGWDFEHNDGTRLQVKQSAARQTWAAPALPRPARFDIKPRTGYWQDGVKWLGEPGRHAHIYVFARHPVLDESADHRDPQQWRFHVLATEKLPATGSIGLLAVEAAAPAVRWDELFQAVEATRRRYTRREDLR